MLEDVIQISANRVQCKKTSQPFKTNVKTSEIEYCSHGWKARKKLLLIKNSTQRHLSHFSELPISIFYGFFRFFRVFSAYFADFHAKKFSQKKLGKIMRKKISKFCAHRDSNLPPTGPHPSTLTITPRICCWKTTGFLVF